MKKIKLYYYNSEYNFGDALNVKIFNDLFGVTADYASKINAECIALGSLMDVLFESKMSPVTSIRRILCPKIKIWGTGFIKPQSDSGQYAIRRFDVRALRGRYTLRRMQEYMGEDLEHVVLGDPGLLTSKIFDLSNVEKKYELGIIPHYVDQDSPLLKNIQVKNSIVIDVTQPVEKTLEQVVQCKHVISSAMHGLIVADSFAIPNMRMVLSDKIVGGDYKFIDYYSALDMDLPEKIIMTPETIINDVKFIHDAYRVPQDKINNICNDLIRVFPYK